MTTVYIDVLFVVNLIVDLMLYTSACVLRKKRIIWWRVLCASCVGAVYSCVIFLSNVSAWIVNVGALVFYMLCAWLVMGFVHIRDFLKNVVATVFCAIVFAGIFTIIYRFFDIGSVVVFNQNVLYIDIPVFALLCVAALCLGVMVLISKGFTQVISAHIQYKVKLCFLDKVVELQAQIDTGNAMTDTISGWPILLADYSQIKSLLPVQMQQFIHDSDVAEIEDKYKSRLRMVMCKTAMGEGMLPAFRPDYIAFTYNGKSVVVRHILVVVSKTRLGDVGLYLSPLMFREVKENETFIG